MKKLCVTGFVFTNPKNILDYKNFIPLYVYSVLKAYPEYDVRIYVNDSLPAACSRQLETIGGMGNFQIIENFSIPELDLRKDINDQVGKAIRWLFYDDVFEQYDSYYMGDIDIFICQEKESLYDKHKEHCRFLNIPYSNVVRPSPHSADLSLKYLMKCVLTVGCKETVKYLLTSKNYQYYYRLTGLHFAETKEYFYRIRSVLPEMIKELSEALNKKSNYWHYCSNLNNEHILYKLIEKSGLGLPPVLSTEENLLMNSNVENAQKVGFRPHHGIHLGVFRDCVPKPEYDPSLLEPVYVEYYKQFCDLYNTDSILRNIIDSFPDEIKNIFDNMHLFYKNNQNKYS